MPQTPPEPLPQDVAEILERMRESMPSDLAYARYSTAFLEATAAELARVRQALEDWFVGRFVATATGSNLEKWEALAGLPVAPLGYSDQERRARVSGQLLGRFTYSGEDFLNGVARLADGQQPEVLLDSATGTITLLFSIALSETDVFKIAEFCANSGPAHYQWEVESASSSTAFIAGLPTPTPPETLPPGTVPASTVGISPI